MTILALWIRFVGKTTALYVAIWIATCVVVVLGITAYAFPYQAIGFVSGIVAGVGCMYASLVLRRYLRARDVSFTHALSLLLFNTIHPAGPFSHHNGKTIS